MNLRDEKVMLMQSHKESGLCRQTQSSDPKVTPLGTHKCFIKACAEPRSLSQRIVSVGHTWRREVLLCSHVNVHMLISTLTCYSRYQTNNVREIFDEQHYGFQRELNEWCL